MASPAIYPNGLNLAGTVFANGPATLQLSGPVYFSGGVQWLDTISGNNANAGTLPELPVATLAQALTNSADNGVVIVGAGSSESLSGSQAIGQVNLSIFGCGTGSSRPRYTCTGAVNMFASSVGGLWLEGFYFPASTAAATNRVGLAGASATVKDCYFECGASDTNRALRVNTGSSGSRIVGCSFVTTASRPAMGLEISAAVADIVIENCTFNGGSYGWTDYALKASAAVTRLRVIGGSFSNRSDLGITTTGTTYGIYGTTFDGTSNVRLDA